MTKLTALYEQLQEHLDFNYDINQDGDSLVVMTPFVDYIHDNFNVYISLTDDNKLIFDDNQNTNAEFSILNFDGALNDQIDFTSGQAASILNNYDVNSIHDGSTSDGTLFIKTDNSKIDLEGIIMCIHKIESAQIAMMTYLKLLNDK